MNKSPCKANKNEKLIKAGKVKKLNLPGSGFEPRFHYSDIFRIQQCTRWIILVLVFLNLTPTSAVGSDVAWRSIGLRSGIDDNRNDEDFQQYESYATWSLPWRRQWNSGWILGTFLETNAGLLRGGGESGFVGSAGPGIFFTILKAKIDISMGINLTVIGKHKFGDENLGGPLEFTSHIGINFNPGRHFTIGYRLQHMSNAVLYEHNPGLNMHMLELGYRF